MEPSIDFLDLKAFDCFRRNNYKFGDVKGFCWDLATPIATKILVMKLLKVAMQDKSATILQMKDFVRILDYKAFQKSFPKVNFIWMIFDSTCNNLDIKFTAFAFVIEVETSLSLSL